MGRHDRIGAEIIASAFDCRPLSAIISNHHAFYGGAARDPHLPAGENIPIGARLLCIADSYDAMVSDRVYRSGRSHAEAVEELRRCAGTQFDPKLVEHFVNKIESQSPSVAAGALGNPKANGNSDWLPSRTSCPSGFMPRCRRPQDARVALRFACPQQPYRNDRDCRRENRGRGRCRRASMAVAAT